MLEVLVNGQWVKFDDYPQKNRLMMPIKSSVRFFARTVSEKTRPNSRKASND